MMKLSDQWISSTGPLVIAVLLLGMAFRLHQLRTTSSALELQHTTSLVPPPSEGLKSAVHFYTPKHASSSSTSPPNVTICRIFHACRLPSGQLLLPYWMKSIDEKLKIDCNIQSPLYTLPDSSSDQTSSSMDAFHYELNYLYASEDLLEIHPPRFARISFVIDILSRLLLSKIIESLHDEESKLQENMQHNCYNKVGSNDCIAVDHCLRSESNATSVFSNVLCSLKSKFRLVVLESELLFTSHSRTWQKQTWDRLQRVWSPLKWTPIRKQKMYLGAGLDRAVCFRSITVLRSNSEEDSLQMFKESGDSVRESLLDVFNLAVESRQLGVKQHKAGEQAYCLVRVLILVRVINSNDEDELLDASLSDIHQRERDESEDFEDDHDIPKAEELRTALLNSARRGKLWALQFEVQIAKLDALSIDEQIALLQNADVVVAANNVQLASVLFMRRFSTLIEVYPFGCLSNSYRMIASTMRIRHFSVISAPEPDAFIPCIRESNPIDSAAAATVISAYQEALTIYEAHGTPVNLKLDEHYMYHANQVATCAHRQKLRFDKQKVADAIIADAIRQCRIEL